MSDDLTGGDVIRGRDGDVIPPRPRVGDLIPQAHGGALRARPPANGGSSFRAAKKLARQELALMTPTAMDRAWQLMHSADERVAAMMTKEILDRTMPREEGTGWEDDGAGWDLSRLTPEEHAELSAAVAVVRRLRAKMGAS